MRRGATGPAWPGPTIRAGCPGKIPVQNGRILLAPAPPCESPCPARDHHPSKSRSPFFKPGKPSRFKLGKLISGFSHLGRSIGFSLLALELASPFRGSPGQPAQAYAIRVAGGLGPGSDLASCSKCAVQSPRRVVVSTGVHGAWPRGRPSYSAIEDSGLVTCASESKNPTGGPQGRRHLRWGRRPFYDQASQARTAASPARLGPATRHTQARASGRERQASQGR